MARKLKYVESLCVDVSPDTKKSNKHQSRHGNCVDSDGIARLNGDVWSQDNCTECNCQVIFKLLKIILSKLYILTNLQL